jgi:Ca-activated chloride channel family protein
MNVLKILLILWLVLFVHLKSWCQQDYPQKPPELTRILFLLDGSGSMLAPLENSTRIQVAKEVLSQLVDSLRAVENLELALRVYGHQYARKEQNCRDTRLEVSFAPNNHNLIKTRLGMIKPKGTTPLAYSLEQAANDFPSKENVRNVLIIITDGLESCDGDPCAISEAIQRNNVLLKPFVIGLGLDIKVKEQFDCLGAYLNANNISSFKNSLRQITEQSLLPTTVSVELLGKNKAPSEKDVNVSFINNFTGQTVYDFVHYRDRNGMPDTLFIEPVLTYDLRVNTLPPVYLKNIEIIPGRHNVIEVSVPQGNLRVKQESSTDYHDPVKIQLYSSAVKKRLDLISINTVHKLLSGTYTIEVLTLPPIRKRITIETEELTTVTIDAPGVVNVNLGAAGILSLYELDPEGRDVWLKNLAKDKKALSFALQPGNYKLVYRANMAKGSKYTLIREFEVSSGRTVNLRL